MQELQHIVVDEVGIKGHTNLSEAVTKWEAILHSTETKEDFFFFTSNKYAIFIPKSPLTDEQEERIRGMMNASAT